MAKCNVQGTDEHGALIVKVSGFAHEPLSAAARARVYEAAPGLVSCVESVLYRIAAALSDDGCDYWPELAADIAGDLSGCLPRATDDADMWTCHGCGRRKLKHADGTFTPCDCIHPDPRPGLL